jgi:DNA modification methylase
MPHTEQGQLIMAKKRQSASDAASLFGNPADTLSSLRVQTIYCGDNLDKLRTAPDKCVDLIYIDPPFNSNRNYEVFWGEAKEKRAFEDRHESTRAYIEYMRPRCVELARVLKPTGSFYYHCDWHASHYVKVMLDQIFGENNFQNEIVWKRTTAHNTTSRRYGQLVDSIFFYTGSGKYFFNAPREDHDERYIKEFYRHAEEDGRRYRLHLVERNEALGIRPNLIYQYNGFTPEYGWMMEKPKLEALDKQGKLVWSKNGKPSRKIYLNEVKKPPLGNLWDDIAPVQAQAGEKLGYPTQKPLALLERIIHASSNLGDVVLDAFCGCGTALVAAEQLERKWIGIDISPTACRVMAGRLKEVCKLREGKDFVVRDLPRSTDQLRAMPPFEFENWAVIAIGGIPNKAQVGDKGIDGRIYPIAAVSKKNTSRDGTLDFMNDWYPVQVKQKDKAGRPDIDAFETAMQREGRSKGYFVSFDFTSDALHEISGFFTRTGCSIIALTVQEILDEEIARKLA